MGFGVSHIRHGPGIGGQAEMGQQGPFGQAGGAAGIDDGKGVVVLGPRYRKRGPGPKTGHPRIQTPRGPPGRWLISDEIGGHPAPGDRHRPDDPASP